MRGKFILPLAAFAIVQSASAVYLVESFENGVYTVANASSKAVSQSTLNVTDGNFSMKIDDLNGGWSFTWGGYGSTVYDKWFANTKMLIDVYFPARADFQQVQLVLATNSDNGWDQKEAVGWKWLNAGQDYRATIEWDYSAQKDNSITASSWFQIHLFGAVPGKGSAVSYPCDIYVDNIRFDGAPVPEPMTLIALGGGLLAVAVRRRRK